ncbi:MAG: hypothetical protein OXR62_02160 [Ahrensia sp.]|nr:hypothetical protein [Ahrensia sp.]
MSGAANQGVVDVAAVLLTVGRERAARLLAHFEAEEVTMLSRQTDNLASLTQNHLNSVAQSFEQAFANGTGLLNPARSFTDILNETRADVLSPEEEVVPALPEPQNPWEKIALLDDQQIADYLSQELPVTSACVLSKLPPAKSAKVLKLFDPDLRGAAVRMMLDVKASQRMEDMLAERLTSELGDAPSPEAETGNWKAVASIINCFDEEDGNALTEQLKSATDEQTYDAVVGAIFRFDDIASLEADACTKLCGTVGNDLLTKALRDADDAISNALLSTLSPRARRMVESELETGAVPKEEEIADARRAIAQTALDMAAEGEITLPERS